MESKVFWGVLCALLVFSGIMWLLFALGVVGLRAATNEASRQAAVQLQQQQAELQQQLSESQQRQREAVAMSWDRRLLQGNQRCVGGVVVVAEGASYTQLGTVGDPVRCEGRYADREIR